MQIVLVVLVKLKKYLKIILKAHQYLIAQCQTVTKLKNYKTTCLLFLT